MTDRILPPNDHRQAVHVALQLVERAHRDLTEARRIAEEFDLLYLPANCDHEADVAQEISAAMAKVSVPWSALAIGPNPMWLADLSADAAS